MENDFFDTENEEEMIQRDHKVFVLIIYDIVDNKSRRNFAKLMQGYGFRVQKSSFEALISRRQLDILLTEILPFVSPEDSVRLYRIHGQGEVYNFGKEVCIDQEEVIFV